MKLQKMMFAAVAVLAIVCAGCKNSDDSDEPEPIPEYLRVTGTAVVGFRADIPADVTIPKGITSIEDNAFIQCDRLKRLSIPNSVTYIGKMAFYGCDSLEKVTMGTGVTYIGEDAFKDCDQIESIAIPSSVTEIGANAFSGCYKLEGVYITDMTKWMSISFGNSSANPLRGGVLYLNNNPVRDYEFPRGITSISGYAFYGCTSLVSVTIPDSVTEITTEAFSGCTSLARITVEPNNRDYSSQNGILYNKAKTQIIYVPRGISGSVTIPDGVTSIASSDFNGCELLTAITIPNSVKKIGDYAFSNCPLLTNVVYNGDFSQWITIEGYNDAFSADVSITYSDGTTMPQYLKIETTEEGGSIVTGYRGSPQNVVIPSGVTKISSYAFQGCTSLVSITIPSSVTEIGYNAFRYCNNLNAVYITDIERWLSISFGSSSDNPLSYAHNLYLNNMLVQELYIYYGVTEINSYAFYGCTSLVSITLPNSVTSIGSYAFCNCTSLMSITIPNSITSIYTNAFNGSSLLSSVNYNGTQEEWKALGVSFDSSNIVVHCTDGAIMN